MPMVGFIIYDAVSGTELLLLGGLPFYAPAEPDLADFGDQHTVVIASWFSSMVIIAFCI